MSDVEMIAGAVPRLLDACRRRSVADPSGTVSVSERQSRILQLLDDRDPVMVGELAEFMGVTASTMSLTLTRLEAAGCIRRTRDPEDRRVMNVVLTELGRDMRDRTTLLDPSRIDAMLGTLRPEERRSALDGLRLLVDAADRMVARGDSYVNDLTDGA
ncbi:MAG: MarR family transcriptional regulator [Gemmatimonadota bacterium]|nr:MarR family transcriptional regulator [Gemmatimonadota bacterium]